MIEEESDYITINPAVASYRYNVVVMKWDHTLQEYVVFRCSQAISDSAAKALARSWAAATKLEIR